MGEDFFTISDILNQKVFDFSKGQNALKYSTIFSFWPQIAGKKFENCSKPYAIKGQRIYVSCENSFVVQELIMHKNILLNKLKVYTEPLGLSICDFVFEFKSWSDNSKSLDWADDSPVFYSEDKIEAVKIDQTEFKNAFENIDNSPYLNDELKAKFKKRIIRLSKARHLREE